MADENTQGQQGGQDGGQSGQGQQHQGAGKTFTQDEVDRIVAEVMSLAGLGAALDQAACGLATMPHRCAPALAP